jgi:hypothetical protein
MKNAGSTFLKINFSKKHNLIASDHTYKIVETKTNSQKKKAF